METLIKSLSRKQIEAVFSDLGLPGFRSKQLIEWLYGKNVSSFSEMTNLPGSLRDYLSKNYLLSKPDLIDKQLSKDGTRKYLLEFPNARIAETVGIPSNDGRLTVCCSSQSGCAMGCTFCATGKQGLIGNLYSGEIVDQVLLVQKDFNQRVSNIVVMGQGEPFANFDNVIEAMRICNDPSLLNIGARKITLSTCGVIPGIEKFADIEEQFTLAVSLHSAIQSKRNELMPGVRNWPLRELKEALIAYAQNTNRRITFEYALMNEVNDGFSDLDALLKFLDGLLCHVNLIPLNKVAGSIYNPTPMHTVEKWSSRLNSEGIETSIRNSRGSDIDGACGQLASIHAK